MSKVKVAVVGTGGMGKKHTTCLKKMEDVDIIAICDINAEAVANFKKIMELESTIYTNFDEMLEKEKLDAIYFCLPPFAHNGEVIRAAEKGINVFLEKPIALTSEAAKPIVEAIEKNRVISQVGHQIRFRKSIQKLYAMIADGSAGKPTIFQGRFWCNIGEGPGWWPKIDKSGGQILEQTIHIYDLVLSLFGDVKTACGAMSNITYQDNSNYEVEDTAAGLITFENGAIATVTGSNASVPVHFFGDFQIGFENVSLEYKSCGQDWVTPDQATLYYGNDKVETFVEDEDVYFLENQDFITAVKNGGKAQIPARDGLRDIKVIEKIIASAGAGLGEAGFR